MQKADIIQIIDKSAEELHQKIEMYRYLMTTILNKKVSEKSLNHMLFPQSKREVRLSATIQEAIDVLEDTRKAFKSKRLEVLRKKMMQTLIENE
jgi:hypothetical protein